MAGFIISPNSAALGFSPLVLEGQHDLKQTLAPKSRVEEPEEQVEFLKLAIRGMVQDIAELKKAQ